MKISRASGLFTTEIILFFSLWLVYGLAINSSNLQQFDLQQVGVESIVERHHFYLEGTPDQHAIAGGDTFSFNGHIYAAKQPGQFMAGAFVYSFLHFVGLSYVKNYLLVSGLVTFFTTSLLTALAGVVVLRLARQFGGGSPQLVPLLIAVVFALGTTTFAYSGIAHHDAMASDFLVIAFYLIAKVAPGRSPARKNSRALLAGLCLGLTITTSMLPFLMVLVVAAYFVSLRQWKLVLPFVLGGILGLAPLLIYDAISFRNPLLLPNVAGNFSDTFFYLDWQNFRNKIDFYTKSISFYVPVFWPGLLGLYFLARERPREGFFLLASIAVLAFYIFNIASVGGCLYGPRYLLPAMPFISVGLIGFRQLSQKKWTHALTAAILVVSLFSIAVNLIGAVQGAMFCDLSKYGFTQYLSAIVKGEVRSFPLLPLLLPFVFVLSVVPIITKTGTSMERARETE